MYTNLNGKDITTEEYFKLPRTERIQFFHYKEKRMEALGNVYYII